MRNILHKQFTTSTAKTTNVNFNNLKPLLFSRSYHSSSSLQQKRLTNLERSNITLDDNLEQVLVGNILGDVYMRRFSTKANTRIVFRQGSINAAYLLHLYSLYLKFVSTPPSVTTITDSAGKTRYNLSFTTLDLPCFNPLYEKFYVNGKKVVPANIADILTPVGLAYWIMDDGGFTGTGLKIYTNAFSQDELNLLVEALDTKFSIKASIHKSSIENQRTIYIKKKQLPLVIDLVKEHMHPSMLYKLNIDK